jgi:hypothetical protein
MKRKTILIIAAILAITCVAVGYFIWHNQSLKENVTSYKECVAADNIIQDSYPEVCVTPQGKRFTNDVSQTMTLEGTVACLPHKNADGPQTLECAVGLKTNGGKYYGLKNESTDTTLSEAAGSDRKVTITGALVTSSDTIYKIEGTINVNRFEFIN